MQKCLNVTKFKKRTGLKKSVLFCIIICLSVSLQAQQKASDYQAAAERGDVAAQYILGVCYEKGQGVIRSGSRARFWYQKAATQGLAVAQYVLGYSYYVGYGLIGENRDVAQAVKWFYEAAKQGDAEVQPVLKISHKEGLDSQDQDYIPAVEWIRRATTYTRDATAQFYLGACYEQGLGVNKSYRQAVDWYRKAAEQGLALAQLQLGICYENGFGVEKDGNAALYWYELSIKTLSGKDKILFAEKAIKELKGKGYSSSEIKP